MRTPKHTAGADKDAAAKTDAPVESATESVATTKVEQAEKIIRDNIAWACAGGLVGSPGTELEFAL